MPSTQIKRMHKGGSMFWGVLFISIGVILLLNYVLGINLPLIRILFSIGVIYLGITLLFGSFGLKVEKVASDNQTVFTENELKWSDPSARENEFDNVLGKSVLDLTHLGPLTESKTVTLNSVMGELKVQIHEDTPFSVESQTVFGVIYFDGKKHSGFGENEWNSQNYVAGQPHLKIVITSVMGKVEIVRK